MAIYSRSSLQNFDHWWFWIRKKNALLSLIKEQDDIGEIYSYAKDLSDLKHGFLIKKREDVGIKYCHNPNAFNSHNSNTMDDVYVNIDNYNPSRKKILIVFDDMIADIMSNKKVQAIVKELFIRCRKVNISLVFITQSFLFFCSK